MTNDQINVALGVAVLVAVGGFLVYHVREGRGGGVPSVVPPNGTVPFVAKSFSKLPDFLTVNLPMFGPLPALFMPNPAGQTSGDNTGGTLYGGPYLG